MLTYAEHAGGAAEYGPYEVSSYSYIRPDAAVWQADMEQAANSAILSAMREMEQVYSGEKVLHKGPGGGAPNGAGGGAVGATAPGAGGEHEGSSFGGKMMSFFKNL